MRDGVEESESVEESERVCGGESVENNMFFMTVGIGDLMLLPGQLASSVNLQEKRREKRVIR